MELFGPYEIGRTLDASGGATVYQARKEGDRKGQFAVKVFSLERLVSEEQFERTSELDPLFKDIGASFTNRVNLQKKAAEGSKWFAPILSAGHDERGAWYATNFYTRSVKGMLDRFVALEAHDLFHIVESTVEAALYLKKTFGRSHGNLKPSNIFLEGAGKPRNSGVILSDPLPGGAGDAARYELADLRAIGEAIYQLVMRRKVDFSTGWVILPIEATKEWTEMFGKKSAEWLDLCNRLLDQGLSLNHYSLEKFEADLPRLKPKLPPTVVLAPVAAILLLTTLVVGAFFAFRSAKSYSLVITTDPPGATLIITPVDEITGKTNAMPADGKPLKLQLDEGEYSIKAVYENLEARRIKVAIVPGKTVTTNISLSYGRLVVLSQPPGAEFSLGSHGPALRTPYTNRYFRPGSIALQLSLQEFETASLSNTVPATHGEVVMLAKMERPPPGDVLVGFTSDPPGAEVFLDGASVGNAPLSKSVKEGSHRFGARLPWFTAQERTVTVTGKTNAQTFQFAYGVLNLASDPVGARVSLGNQPVAVTPTNLNWPVGQYAFTFSADGYDSSTQQVAVVSKATNSYNPALAARAGFVELTSDPPGAEIRDQNDKVLGTTIADGVTRLALTPKVTYTLKAIYADLRPVVGKTVQVNPAETKRIDPFRFEYGTAIFADVQPADTRSTVRIHRSSGKSPQLGEQILQRPNENYFYQIEAPGYQSITTNIVVGPKSTRQITLALVRQTVPVSLTSDPPGARFFSGDAEITQNGPGYPLPWGPLQLVARYGRLGAVTNMVNIQLSGQNSVAPFKFDYGTLVLTNFPDGALLKEGNEQLTTAPGPGKLAYDRPGSHTYEVYRGGRKVDTLTTNVVSGLALILPYRASARELVNSIGMVLVKVDNLSSPGKDGWVGKFEVTQKEYQTVMGNNPSDHQSGDNYPVENVDWGKAMEFCQKLSQKDKAAGLYQGDYTLPTRDQWLYFAKDTDVKDAVVKAAGPAPVGSKGPNPLGLYDTRGNVWEWLLGIDGANKPYIGGAYSSRFPRSIDFGATEDRAQTDAQPDIGFRVILVPAQ